MPQPTKGARLGGSPAHQRLILANLATSLFEHGRITTTEAKARRLRPYAERLITKAKAWAKVSWRVDSVPSVSSDGVGVSMRLSHKICTVNVLVSFSTYRAQRKWQIRTI